MFWTVLALVLTVLMGGIIAYNGDLIGRKYGKRRLSLFGMRPKHTAILITSMTGVFVSALTTGVLFLLVPPVRAIILEGEEAIRTRDAAKAEARMLAQQNTGLRQDNETQKQELQQLTANITTLRSKNDNLTENNQALGKQNYSLAHTGEQLKRTNTKLTGTNNRLALDIHAKQKQNRELDKTNQELGRQSEQLTRNNVRLTKDNSRLDAAYRRYIDSFGNDFEELKRSVKELTAQCASLKTENSHLAEQNKTLTAQASKPDEKTNNLLKMCEAMLTKRVVIHGGEDLARKVIPAGASPDEVRQALRDLIHKADVAAQSKGAGGNGGQAVRLVDKEFVRRTQSGLPVSIDQSEDAQIDDIVGNVAERAMPVCVQAVAVANSVENEPASITLKVYVNRLVYPQGKVVAARSFDGSQDPERVFADLITFLHDLGQSAIRLGMIPRVDPTTGERQVGSVSALRLANLMERIRTLGGSVEITAVSAADTNAADPLDLDFRIEPTH